MAWNWWMSLCIWKMIERTKKNTSRSPPLYLVIVLSFFPRPLFGYHLWWYRFGFSFTVCVYQAIIIIYDVVDVSVGPRILLTIFLVNETKNENLFFVLLRCRKPIKKRSKISSKFHYTQRNPNKNRDIEHTDIKIRMRWNEWKKIILAHKKKKFKLLFTLSAGSLGFFFFFFLA